MRTFWRTLTPAIVRDAALVSLGVLLVAVSYGATAVSAGMPAWMPPLIAILVLAGSAEFLFVGILVATYSTLFVAAPLYSLFRENEPQLKARDARIRESRSKASVEV